MMLQATLFLQNFASFQNLYDLKSLQTSLSKIWQMMYFLNHKPIHSKILDKVQHESPQ